MKNVLLTKCPLRVTKHANLMTRQKNYWQNNIHRCRYGEKIIILRSMRRFTTFLFYWLVAMTILAGDSIVSQLSYRRFTTLDGLPQMQAETVFQDSEG